MKNQHRHAGIIFRIQQLLTAGLLLCFFLGSGAFAQEKPTLRVLNWRNYIDVDDDLPEELPMAERSPTLKEFAEKFNCNIEYHEFDDFEDMSSKFLSLPGFHDIMMLSCTHTPALINTGWLLPISEATIPNLKYIDAATRTPLPDPNGQFLVPYMNDYLGLLYRKDKLKINELAWSQYFNPPAGLKGHMGIMNFAPEMFTVALMAGKAPAFSNASQEQIDAAYARIVNVLQNFDAELTDSPGDQIIENDHIWLTPVYASDARIYLEKNANIGFLVPKGGTEYYNDFMVIHRESQNVELAQAFVNYLLEPEVMGRIAAYVDADPPSAEARRIRANLEPPAVPSATGADGHPLPGMLVSYTFDPRVEIMWLQATTGL